MRTGGRGCREMLGVEQLDTGMMYTVCFKAGEDAFERREAREDEAKSQMIRDAYWLETRDDESHEDDDKVSWEQGMLFTVEDADGKRVRMLDSDAMLGATFRGVWNRGRCRTWPTRVARMNSWSGIAGTLGDLRIRR